MNTVLAPHPDGITLVLPSDPIAGPQAVAFRTWMEQLVQSCGRVVVDLSRVQFVDSSGCGALLRTHQQLVARGGGLAVCGVVAPVRALFDLLRLHRALHVLPTREEAARFLLGTPHQPDAHGKPENLACAY